MARQLHFYRLANTLRAEFSLPKLASNREHDDAQTEAKVAEKVSEMLPLELFDLTHHFTDCESKMIEKGMEKLAYYARSTLTESCR